MSLLHCRTNAFPDHETGHSAPSVAFFPSSGVRCSLRYLETSMALKLLLGLLIGGTVQLSRMQAAEPEFQSLFDGKDLTGWTGNPKLWSVKDGALTGQTSAENSIKDNTF